MFGYNVAIARLRGVSILVVMIMHYARFFSLPIDLPKVAIANGYYGVTTFFAVSGFLITRSIRRRYGGQENISLPDFYLTRAARIIPTLGLLLAVLVVLSFSPILQFQINAPLSLGDTLWYVVTLRYNLYFAFHSGYRSFPWFVLWSLTIEEVFYLGYPLLLKLSGRLSTLTAILAAVVIAGPLVRANSIGISGLYQYFGCFDAIAMGALAALAVTHFQNCNVVILRGLMMVGAALLSGVYISMDIHANYVIAPSLIAAGACLVLIASTAIQPSTRHPNWMDWLGHCGNYSYELYLFHMVVISLTVAWWPSMQLPAIVPFCLIFPAIFLVSMLINRYYAEPLNTYIRRRFRTHSSMSDESINARALSPELSQ